MTGMTGEPVCVLDVSVALAWYLPGERTDDADRLLDAVADGGAVVPGTWRLEIANGLQSAVRRRRIDTGFRDRALRQLDRLPIETDADTHHFATSTTLWLADRCGLTLYPAVYLDLAQRRSLALATLDRALEAAARDIGVRLALEPR